MADYVKARGHRKAVYGFAVVSMSLGVVLVANSRTAFGGVLVVLGLAPAFFYASHRSGGLVDAPCVDELLSVVQYGAFVSAGYFLTYPFPSRFVESRPIPGTLVGVTVAVAVAIAPLRYANTRDLFGTPWA